MDEADTYVPTTTANQKRTNAKAEPNNVKVTTLAKIAKVKRGRTESKRKMDEKVVAIGKEVKARMYCSFIG